MSIGGERNKWDLSIVFCAVVPEQIEAMTYVVRVLALMSFALTADQAWAACSSDGRRVKWAERFSMNQPMRCGYSCQIHH